MAPINVPTGIVEIAYDGMMARHPASSIDELSTMVDSVTLTSGQDSDNGSMQSLMQRVFSQPVRAIRRTDTVNIRASSDIGTRKQSVTVHRRDGVPSLAL
jgi:hypothetical protein